MHPAAPTASALATRRERGEAQPRVQVVPVLVEVGADLVRLDGREHAREQQRREQHQQEQKVREDRRVARVARRPHGAHGHEREEDADDAEADKEPAEHAEGRQVPVTEALVDVDADGKDGDAEEADAHGREPQHCRGKEAAAAGRRR